MNSYGCRLRSKQTGIILNDSMNDFAIPGRTSFQGIPPSPANRIRPLKQSLSSKCPSILLDENGKVELLIGGGGGPKIISAVSYVRMTII